MTPPTHRDAIIAYLGDGRIVRPARLVVDVGCPRNSVARLVADGTLFAYGGGLRLGGLDIEAPPENLVRVALRIPRGVIVGEGAACSHGLLDENILAPLEVLVPVTGYVYRGDRDEREGGWCPILVRQTRNPGKLTAFTETRELAPGAVITLTDPARTVCDLVDGRHELAAEALGRYVNSHPDGFEAALRQLSATAHALGCLDRVEFAVEAMKADRAWTRRP